MVKNTECLNTTNRCVLRAFVIILGVTMKAAAFESWPEINGFVEKSVIFFVINATTVFNSRRCSKGMFNTIHFLKIAEEKKLLREYFE